MARATARLVHALRVTAARIDEGGPYKWSDYGKCNCGHLAQTLTGLSPREIYEAAFERPGDWGEQTRGFCTSSGYAIDHILETMIAAGLKQDEIEHLERLSHPAVLRSLPVSERFFQHHSRNDAVRYFRAWADLLASQLSDIERARLHRLDPIAADSERNGASLIESPRDSESKPNRDPGRAA